MANHLSHLLTHWYDNRDRDEWVLGTVYDTRGPCYRKSGAMMLFSSAGQQLGMLSGGCLESDIAINARKVMQNGGSLTLCYDGSDEDDLSFQLGIGCGGTVYIMLQPVNAQNKYLHLDTVHLALCQRQSGRYFQRIPSPALRPGIESDKKEHGEQAHFEIAAPGQTHRDEQQHRSQLVQDSDQTWLATPIIPEPHLLIVGGGLDAQPLVAMAHQLGWQISLWDPRPANARREYFLHADKLLSFDARELSDYATNSKVTAAILMAHNVLIDAAALKALQHNALSYMAMLGPRHRRDQVLAQAQVDIEQLSYPLAGPAGLDIGAQLPEGIALSILAECHASLKQRQASSRSDILPPVVELVC